MAQKKHSKQAGEKILRRQIESKGPGEIRGAEQVHPKDSFHYLRAGLDQITCKIAKKKNKTIVFHMNDLRQKTSAIKQAKVLGRMQQNMRLCRKFNVKTKTKGLEKEALQRVLEKQQ